MKEKVVVVLKKALKEYNIKISPEEIEKLIEIPPSTEMGDYAFPCYFLSQKLKQDPKQIALELRAKITSFNVTDFDDVQTAGPYINFLIDRKALARKVVWEAINQRGKYGQSKIGKTLLSRKKIVIDLSSPNIAKPIGIGHLRSTIIGNSLANISDFIGYKPIKINWLGDWGAQFGKLIFAFKEFGSEKKLEKDPIKYLLQLYVKVSKSKKYEESSREAFKKLEQGNKESLMLWKAFRELSIEEFKKFYKVLGIEFDVWTGESEYVKKSDEIIEILKKKNLLIKSQGAWIVDLKEYNLGVVLIKKTDETTLYATRDLATALDRYRKYSFDKMLYEVGQEQTLHFQQIFKVLELMGYDWAKKCTHVAHGLYLDKDGKKFATRKGKTMFMEDILEDVINLASKEIKKRTPDISKQELEERAHKVAIAAIFYGDLKNNPKNDIIFDLKRFVSFEGDTGPYLLYSYARATSILKKAENKIPEWKIENLDDKEYELVKKLSLLQQTVLDSWKNLNPSIIANYSYQLAQTFNEFYQTCPVINSENEAFRLALVEAFRQVLRNSLKLLGINVLEEM